MIVTLIHRIVISFLGSRRACCCLPFDISLFSFANNQPGFSFARIKVVGHCLLSTLNLYIFTNRIKTKTFLYGENISVESSVFLFFLKQSIINFN